MKANNIIRAVKSGKLTGALILSAVGIILMLFPGITLGVLSGAAGIIVGLIGLTKLIVFFTSGGFGSIFGCDLFSGIFLTAAAMFMLTSSEAAVGIAAAVCGAAVLINGVLKLGQAVRLRRCGYFSRKPELISAVLSVIAGLLLVVCPVATAKAAGIAAGAAVLLTGIADGVLTVMLERNVPEDKYSGAIKAKFREC